jgi:glycosyltransferase involved in cell wall biosynthesis
VTAAAAGGSPPLSVVVAVYERAEVLELVFASLHGQTLRDFEVVVADDGSGPAIGRLIERCQPQFARPIVHVWHEDDGFRKTIVVNRAVTKASSDYLVFIDGDCILHRRFLERHYKRRRPGWVLTGRRVMMDSEFSGCVTLDDVRSRRIERPSFWLGHCGRNDCKHGFYLPFMFTPRAHFRKNYEILGSNFSVHRDDFYRVNGYDERIVGRGVEDNNLCIRFINSGIAVKSVAFEALQYHCYHEAEGIPHSEELIAQLRNSKETRTPFGVFKD